MTVRAVRCIHSFSQSVSQSCIALSLSALLGWVACLRCGALVSLTQLNSLTLRLAVAVTHSVAHCCWICLSSDIHAFVRCSFVRLFVRSFVLGGINERTNDE